MTGSAKTDGGKKALPYPAYIVTRRDDNPRSAQVVQTVSQFIDLMLEEAAHGTMRASPCGPPSFTPDAPEGFLERLAFMHCKVLGAIPKDLDGVGLSRTIVIQDVALSKLHSFEHGGTPWAIGARYRVDIGNPGYRGKLNERQLRLVACQIIALFVRDFYVNLECWGRPWGPVPGTRETPPRIRSSLLGDAAQSAPNHTSA